MEWISVKERLPEERKPVLGYHTRGTWSYPKHPKLINMVVIWLVKGLAEEDRKSLPDNERKRTYMFGDEHGNNEVPYQWDSFGPDSFFGQTISHWKPLPPPPEGE